MLYFLVVQVKKQKEQILVRKKMLEMGEDAEVHRFESMDEAMLAVEVMAEEEQKVAKQITAAEEGIRHNNAEKRKNAAQLEKDILARVLHKYRSREEARLIEEFRWCVRACMNVCVWDCVRACVRARRCVRCSGVQCCRAGRGRCRWLFVRASVRALVHHHAWYRCSRHAVENDLRRPWDGPDGQKFLEWRLLTVTQDVDDVDEEKEERLRNMRKGEFVLDSDNEDEDIGKQMVQAVGLGR